MASDLEPDTARRLPPPPGADLAGYRSALAELRDELIERLDDLDVRVRWVTEIAKGLDERSTERLSAEIGQAGEDVVGALRRELDALHDTVVDTERAQTMRRQSEAETEEQRRAALVEDVKALLTHHRGRVANDIGALVDQRQTALLNDVRSVVDPLAANVSALRALVEQVGDATATPAQLAQSTQAVLDAATDDRREQDRGFHTLSREVLDTTTQLGHKLVNVETIVRLQQDRLDTLRASLEVVREEVRAVAFATSPDRDEGPVASLRIELTNAMRTLADDRRSENEYQRAQAQQQRQEVVDAMAEVLMTFSRSVVDATTADLQLVQARVEDIAATQDELRQLLKALWGT